MKYRSIVTGVILEPACEEAEERLCKDARYEPLEDEETPKRTRRGSKPQDTEEE